MNKFTANNYTKIVGETGAVAAPLLSRMFSIGDITEDVTPQSLEADPALTPTSLIIVPRGSGTILVHMAGAPFGENYLISSVEVEASIGYPLPYLVDRIIYGADTNASISVGW